MLNSTIYLMPNENYIFFADSSNFPYGTKSKEYITNLGINILANFNDLNAKEVIIACNTMSTSNMQLFKDTFKNMNIIGTFPNLTQIFTTANTVISNKTIYFDKKNGLKISNNKIKLLILATTATSKSEYLQDLIDTYNDIIDIYVEPADFIVKAVENDKLETFEFKNEISSLFKEYYDIDYLLLGCTHFPHAEKQIRQFINNNAKLFSGGIIASNKAYEYLYDQKLITYNESPYIKIIDSKLDDNKKDLYMKLLNTDTHSIEFYRDFNEIID